MKKFWSLFLIGAMTLSALRLAPDSVAVPVHAATKSELEQEISQLKDDQAALDTQIQDLQASLQETAQELEDLTAQKNLIDQEIFLHYQKQQSVQDQIQAYQDLIIQKQLEVNEAQAKLDDTTARNKGRLRAMEKNAGVSYWSVLFQATNVMDLLDRVKMIGDIAQGDKDCLEQVRSASRALSDAQDALLTEKEALDASRRELEAIGVTLEEKRAQADALLQQAIAKGEEFQSHLEDAEDKQDALAQDLASAQKNYDQLIEQEKPPAQKPETTKPETSTPEQPPASSSGWLVPCSYSYVSSPFGYRYHPLSGKWKMHNGVDLAANTGTPIKATRSGYVTTASYEEGGAGYYVSLDHGDGYGSIYMHMTHFIVGYGEYVSQGQVIGYVGSTGGSSGPHLHFGISYKGSYVNPADYISIG